MKSQTLKTVHQRNLLQSLAPFWFSNSNEPFGFKRLYADCQSIYLLLLIYYVLFVEIIYLMHWLWCFSYYIVL